MTDEIKEGIKELLRTALMAVIPLVIISLQDGQIIDWKAITIAGLIAILSGIDKWLHKEDKTIIPIKGATGLTGF